MTHGSTDKSRGFTLLELVIVMIIIAVILGAVAQIATRYVAEKQYHENIAKLTKVQKALGQFYAENGYLPCPAPLTAGMGDAENGIGDCTTLETAPIAGADDSSTIRIGALPFATLNASDAVQTRISLTDTIDSYGNRLTYAVTEEMTLNVVSTEDPAARTNIYLYGVHPPNLTEPPIRSGGAIDVLDESGASLFPQPASTDPELPGYADFFAFFAGPNRGGAYTINGVPTGLNCSGLDTDNCDGDAIFRVSQLDLSGSGYYDDMVLFSLDSPVQAQQGGGDLPESDGEALWSLIGSTDNIYNNTDGNTDGRVGIGTQEPAERLDVAGSARLEGDIVFGEGRMGVGDTPGDRFRIDHDSNDSLVFKDNKIGIGGVPTTDDFEVNGDAVFEGLVSVSEGALRAERLHIHTNEPNEENMSQTKLTIDDFSSRQKISVDDENLDPAPTMNLGAGIHLRGNRLDTIDDEDGTIDGMECNTTTPHNEGVIIYEARKGRMFFCDGEEWRILCLDP